MLRNISFIIFIGLLIASCAQFDTQSTGTNVNVSNMSTENSVLVATPISFSLSSSSDTAEVKAITFTNSTDQNFNYQQEALSDSFSITSDLCNGVIPAQSSCSIDISFAPISNLDTNVRDNFIIISEGGKYISVPLTGIIESKTSNPPAETAQLTVSVTDQQEMFTTIQVSHSGSGTAQGLVPELKGDYLVFSNSCPDNLETYQVCSLIIYPSKPNPSGTFDVKFSNNRSNIIILGQQGL